MNIKSIVIVFLASTGLCLPLVAKESQKDYQPLINSINQLLINNYVFPEVAPKYAAQLNQCLKEKCLSKAENDEQVASILTKQLQSVHKDKHLNIFAPGQRNKMKRRKMVKKSGSRPKKHNLSGIVEQEILEGNIDYLKISSFPGTPASIIATFEAMKKLKDTDAIVFDIRSHRGGSPENISEISNFLFTQATHMVTTRSPYVNEGKPTPHMSEPNEFAKDYKDKPIYLLTSKRSASAAEHFAMSMKATGRGILVGEKTGGWGHWGEITQLEEGFSMFVPSGRTYHPVNKLGWEGIGITPDIMIDAEQSYDYVLERIKAHQN